MAEELGYKVMYLAKKSGGVRIIHDPNPPLKKIQNEILQELSSMRLSFPHSVCAFVRGRSIKSMLNQHAFTQSGFKLDIKDFFHSCTPEMVAKNARTMGVPKELILKVTKYCFVELKSRKGKMYKGLPQGAPTSPLLCNIAVKDLDAVLKNITGNDGVYTRYADDMVFSFVRERAKVGSKKLSEDALKSWGLNINRKKTKVWNSTRFVRVGGVVIKPSTTMYTDELKSTDDRFSIPKRKRDRIRGRLKRMIDDIKSKKCDAGQWISSQLNNKGNNIKRKIHFNKWRGHIAWVKSINPHQAVKLEKLFKELEELCQTDKTRSGKN